MSPHDEGTLDVLDDPTLEYVVGWAQHEDAITGVKAELAGSRAAEVQWVVRDGAHAGGLLLNRLVVGCCMNDQAQFDLLRRFRAMLREYGGIIVVATVKGRPGR